MIDFFDFLIGRVVGDQLLGAGPEVCLVEWMECGRGRANGLNLMGPKIRIMRLRIP